MEQSFIEVQFPVSKVSKESYKERKAGQSQTLTGLGKWWGRKPLILVRATILGLLMPAGNDPKKDRDIFLKILMMDSSGVWKRKNKPIKDPIIAENLTLRELKLYFEVPVDLFSEMDLNQDKLIKQAYRSDISKLKWKPGITRTDKEKATRLAFYRMSYDDRLEYCLRPEETTLVDPSEWSDINKHLGTEAHSLLEVINQLGIKKFGYVPTVGDCFCGGGSIPFEAARLGLQAYASDLNPLAGLLTWAGLNILSLPVEEIEKLKAFQENVFDEVAKLVNDWGIEMNEKGWMAKYYLYCHETVCPHCKTKVPMAPSWYVSKKTRTVAIPKYKPEKNGFEIEIVQNASVEKILESEKMATVQKNSLWCPKCKNLTPLSVLRRDNIDLDGNPLSGLRKWEANEFMALPDDVFTERLYAIKYLEKNDRKTWEQFLKKPAPATDATYGKIHYMAPTSDDLRREEKVIELLKERFAGWQENGFLPSNKIEPGEKTDEPIRTRGWQYWHHLFNPRQLLLNGLFLEIANEFSVEKAYEIIALLGVNRICDFNSKLCRWISANAQNAQTFYNQALNPLENYCAKGMAGQYSMWKIDIVPLIDRISNPISVTDARNVSNHCDLWITDPPYADAVNYHELTEFFLAWDKKFMESIFPHWYTDSKRVLAVKGEGESFNKSMVEIYRNLTFHLPNDGMQVVMFTHQSPSVWADLTLILWSAGLHVTAAWNIATETEGGGLKEGNYVKGTVLMVLRKLTSNLTAFSDTITYEIQEEVKHQIDSMRNLEDKEDPNFSDADYILAAYAAALKVLTGYKKIGDINIEYELKKTRDGRSVNPVEAIINNAIRTAYDYLIPQSFDSFYWKSLSPEERFFIKGMELEKSNVYQLGAYQEMARGFGIKEFKDMLASTRANQVRFKTPLEFGNRWLRGADTFGNTLIRQVIMAIGQSEREENGQAGKAWLKNEVENYWDKRQVILELLRYFTTTEHIDHMTHWENPAKYARYLLELVSNDGT